jgi:nucleoid-associated protein YgaU
MALLLPGCGLVLAWAGWLIGSGFRPGSALQWHSYSELLGLAAAVAGLAVLAWWGLGLLLAISGAVLQRAGHLRLAEFSFAASPAFLRRLVTAIVGLNLLAAPAANASGGHPGHGTPPAAASAAGDGGQADPYFTVPGQAVHRPAPVDPSWQPAAPPASPGLVAGRIPEPQRQPEPGTVTVRAGDTLWDIAARDLGSLATDAEIAAHWPRWYAGNRTVIGADPALLVPGQILTPPSGR